MLAAVLRTDEEPMTERLDAEKGDVWSCRVGLWGVRRVVEPELCSGSTSFFSCWLSICRKMLSLILVPLVLWTLPLLPVLAMVLVWDIMGSARLDGSLAGCTAECWAEAVLVPGCRLVAVSNEHLMAWKSDL